jgi:hypothetical protein
MPDIRPQKQEVRLNKEVRPRRTVKTTINHHPIQRSLKKHPSRADTGQVKQQSQSRPVNQEKIVQVPVQKQLKQPGREIPKPSPMRRPDTKQLAQERKLPQRPMADKQVKTTKKSQVSNNPASHSARPRRATPQHQIVKQQPQSESLSRKTGHVSKRVNPTQAHKVKQKVAAPKPEKIEQKTKHQSRQEIGRQQPQREQRRHR